MTMLDDDRLATLLARAGAAFEVPATGADDIVARAAGSIPGAAGGDGTDGGGSEADAGDGAAVVPVPARDGRVQRLVAVAGRHRVLSVAACVVVALVIAGGVAALVRAPAGPTLTSSLPRGGPVTSLHAPATTTPRPAGAAAGPHGTVAAPPSSGVGGASQGTASTPSITTPSVPTTPSLPGGAVGQSARIEQTGTLGLTVGRGRLDPAMTQLTALAGAFGGFVANSQTQSGEGTGGTPYGSITLQVPVDDFSAVLKQAQALGKTSSLTTKATDVTGQYVDLQARITALEASRQQYLSILAKATTVGDVLAVQEQLDGIQSQIEQLQGQLQVLTSETSYSTLTVTVSEGAPPPRPAPLPESGLVRAWHDSIGGFVAGVEGVVRLAGPALFALLCLGVLLVGGRALWRRYQRHRL
ncbi:MAG: DUF4349 domain-containing protein [Acidimicrobiales bacterium]